MKKSKGKSEFTCCGCSGSFWGWFFVILGVYFLAQFLGWIPSGLPIWTILIIMFGVYLLMKHYKK